MWIASKCVSLHYHVQLRLYVPCSTWVVNCFKMCIFALSRTTTYVNTVHEEVLWIASKCVSLHYHVQLKRNFILDPIVVNCFKMCIFALSRTTNQSFTLTHVKLWIASKCVSLHYHVQLKHFTVIFCMSCELLQNVYLCIITYNEVEQRLQDH